MKRWIISLWWHWGALYRWRNEMEIKMAVREKSQGFDDVKVNHVDDVIQWDNFERFTVLFYGSFCVNCAGSSGSDLKS